MEKYRDMKIKKRANLKMLRNLIFFVLLIIVTFWFLFKDQDLNEIKTAITSVKIEFVLIALLIMFLSFLTESYNIKSVLSILGDKKISIFKALKFTFIGFFFSAITPASTGGQPVEVYYMSKEKIKTANGTLAMMIQLSGYQIAALSISLICAILYPGILKDGIVWFFLLGFIFNTIATAFMLLAIFSKKTTKKLVEIFIRLLKLMHIKNLEIKKQKIEDGLNQYNESASFIKNHKGEFFKAVLRVFIQIVLLHSIPFFISKAFGLDNHSFLEIFAMQALLYTTVCSIPLPGSVGVSESLFLKIFGMIFSTNIVSAAMLINRFISFYFYVIVSVIVVVINAIRFKNVKGEIDISVDEIEKNM